MSQTLGSANPAPSGPSSSEQMVADLYFELRRLASAKMFKLPPGQTLQATALVHEAYLRLSRDPLQQWQNRAHFFASAAEAMRRILVDQARRKSALRRSATLVPEPIDALQIATPEPEDRILAVHDVVDELERENPIQAQIVKLRFFGGLDHHETAALLELSEKSVRRQWNAAKLWLYEKIAAKQSGGDWSGREGSSE